MSKAKTRASEITLSKQVLHEFIVAADLVAYAEREHLQGRLPSGGRLDRLLALEKSLKKLNEEIAGRLSNA